MSSQGALTAVVLTCNEASNITECLTTLTWTDERLVMDSYSEDGTPELAREMGAVVVQRSFRHFADQRNAALAHVRTPWTLFVDADERVRPALATEIGARIASEAADAPAGYWIPRDNYIFGRLTRGGGWWPDYQLRLLQTARARYDPLRTVHELVMLDGAAGHLREALVHYNYRSRAQFHQKQRAYTAYDAAILHSAGVRARPHNLVLQPLREFRRRFVTLRGYQDGLHGFQLALLMAYYEWVKYARLWGMSRGERAAGVSGEEA